MCVDVQVCVTLIRCLLLQIVAGKQKGATNQMAAFNVTLYSVMLTSSCTSVPEESFFALVDEASAADVSTIDMIDVLFAAHIAAGTVPFVDEVCVFVSVYVCVCFQGLFMGLRCVLS